MSEDEFGSFLLGMIICAILAFIIVVMNGGFYDSNIIEMISESESVCNQSSDNLESLHYDLLNEELIIECGDTPRTQVLSDSCSRWGKCTLKENGD